MNMSLKLISEYKKTYRKYTSCYYCLGLTVLPVLFLFQLVESILGKGSSGSSYRDSVQNIKGLRLQDPQLQVYRGDFNNGLVFGSCRRDSYSDVKNKQGHFFKMFVLALSTFSSLNNRLFNAGTIAERSRALNL